MLQNWLKTLDGGKGRMLQYQEMLVNKFDADLAKIAAAHLACSNPNIPGAVEPAFWEAIGIAKAGHKMLFARGIAQLVTTTTEPCADQQKKT